ncbi:MAG: hypothetical protein IKU37_02030 [Candidatus Gastranaerophilales bacterium]|nr:hypothetical protein [Candidatus Gastranaerophilales bacterium]
MKAKRCPICDTVYLAFYRECPNCMYKEPLNISNLLAIILVVIVVFLTFFYQMLSEADFLGKIYEKNNLKLNQKEDISSTKEIHLSSMIDLSGLSKAEILDIRRRAIRNSFVFSNIENYTPNPRVYNIQDNLPWISAYEIVKNGTDNNLNIAVGPSRHSIMIKNPEILLGYLIPDYGFRDKKNEPDEVDYFFPKKLIWNEKTNTLKIYFDYRIFMQKYNFSNLTVYTDNTNARDLGFDWIYCKEKKGAVFSAINNIAKVPYKMKGLYHRGYACGLENGCNNYSPLESEMVFKIVSKNAVLKFKLWKNKPITPLQKADINYEMYFE